jgi:hypothetical protein
VIVCIDTAYPSPSEKPKRLNLPWLPGEEFQRASPKINDEAI